MTNAIILDIRSKLHTLGEKHIFKLMAALDAAKQKCFDDEPTLSRLVYLAGYSVLICGNLIKKKEWSKTMSYAPKGSQEYDLVLRLLVALQAGMDQDDLEEIISMKLQTFRFQNSVIGEALAHKRF